MLFVMIMEVLNGLIRVEATMGYTSSLDRCVAHWASFYADDLVLFVAPSRGDILVLKEILSIFGQASGLFTNMDKCVATPIHCLEPHITLISSLMQCKILWYPTLYPQGHPGRCGCSVHSMLERKDNEPDLSYH